ncbi:hypothetical protein OF83DRAFT_1028360, partial [Amylostereum chailletii]
PDDPLGCSRCRPFPSRLCCDLCTPSLLADMGILLTSPSSELRPGSKGRSAIRKKPETDLEESLRIQLREWRQTTAMDVYSRATYKKHGPPLLLSNHNLARIIVCAQANKIKTLEDIKRETLWDKVDAHGAAVLAII